GALFAIGLLWCLVRPWDPRRAALLLPFAAMMAAGVLSVTFEAPQAARTIGATPFVALMGALPLAALSRRLQAGRGLRAGLAAAAGLLALAGAWSFRVFDRQLRDPSAWQSYSTPETRLAEEVRQEGRDADVYVTETLDGGPTVTFVLGEPLRASTFERSRDLPFASRGRPALLFLHGGEEETAALVRELYPQASVEPFGAPDGEGGMAAPVLWTARIPAGAIAGLSGWEVAIEREGRRLETVHAPASEWEWNQAPPPFQARVDGTLRASEDRPVVFEVDGAPATLAVDGEIVLQPGTRSLPLRLASGMHEIALSIPVTRRGERSSLLWSRDGGPAVPLPPEVMFSPRVPAGGLLGAYHDGPDLSGEPAFRRIDPQVSFYFHLLPLPRPFSVRWTGSVYAASAGRYAFGTSAVDSASVAIDGVTVLANDHPSEYRESAVDLDRGWHDIEVRYRALRDYSQVALQWVRPGGERERVPSAVLRPPGPGGRLRERSARAPIAPEPRLPAIPPAAAPGPGAAPVLAVTASRSLPFGEGLRVAIDREGHVFVLDPGGRQVWRLGATSEARPLAGPPEGWIDPADLSVAPDGRLHVLDAGGFIAVYHGASRPERTLDLRPLGVYNPRGLAVGAREILLADTGGGRVLVLDREGRLEGSVGRPGAGPGELSDPADVARDATGGLVVVDAGNGRIQRFRRDGQVEEWPSAGRRSGKAAERLDVASDGAVWVGGGGAPEVWRLAPGHAPRRHALA
ncbi:MAG TPA: PA14 domain-containing protein, partial [Vicinamibacteria bacterium]